MQKPLPAAATRTLRGRYILAGVMMLGLWGAGLAQSARDGTVFNIVTAVLASVTFLPLGLITLWGGVFGSELGMQRARNALFAGASLLMLVVIAEILRRMIFAGS
jgi:hypothetical protein